MDPPTRQRRNWAGGRCGIGMTGMRERVYALGGTIDRRAASDAGTAAVITLPLEAAASSRCNANLL